MELLKPDVEHPLGLDQLCTQASYELLLRGYTRTSIKRYRQVWRHLVDFAKAQGVSNTYSRDLVLRFEQTYAIRKSELSAEAEPWRRHLVFAIKILDDVACTGTITGAAIETAKLRIPDGMCKPLRACEQYARERLCLRQSTWGRRIRCIGVFLDFLGSRGLDSLNEMQVGDLSAFIESKSTWNQNTLATALSDLHQFLRFLFIRNILPRDFSTVLPKIRRIRQSSVPSVWEPELVEKLLGAVDRSSPRGKRDYAVLLLAARLGMRASDIKNLTLDNLHWDSATIEITQSKTGIPLALPMSEEVGTALIDYLRTVRMEVEHRQVFLKMTEPFEPFTERSSLGNIIRHWRVLAGIRFRSKQRKGLHSLRHTLATRLLHAQTPFHIISDVLGHSSSATTFIYAKADVETLRIAAIDPEEVCHVR